MLVSTMTEEEIIHELSKDYDRFIGDILTESKRKMLEERKNDRKGYSLFQYRFFSEKENSWFVEVKYDKRAKKLVYVNPIACMNSGYYNMFILKLNEFDGERKAFCFPAHCIKRIRERIARDVSGMDNFELLNSIFMESEIGIKSLANKEDLLSSVEADIISGDYILISGAGYFVERVGEHIYTFKTFLGDIVKETRNRFLCDYLENEWVKYNREILPNYYHGEEEWPYKQTEDYHIEFSKEVVHILIENLGPVRRELTLDRIALPNNSKDFIKVRTLVMALEMERYGCDHQTALAISRRLLKNCKSKENKL